MDPGQLFTPEERVDLRRPVLGEDVHGADGVGPDRIRDDLEVCADEVGERGDELTEHVGGPTVDEQRRRLVPGELGHLGNERHQTAQ